MTDHAKELDDLAGNVGYVLDCVQKVITLNSAASEFRRLQKLVDNCAPYLADRDAAGNVAIFDGTSSGPRPYKPN